MINKWSRWAVEFAYFRCVEKAKLAVEHAKNTIAEEPTQVYGTNPHLHDAPTTQPLPQAADPDPAPKEQRLQPIGASDPKNYNDHDSGGTDLNSNKTHGE